MENVIKPESTEPIAWGSIVMVLVHGVFWLGLVVAPLFFVVPRFMKVFADFGITVPTVTRWIFRVSAGAHALWYVVPFLILGLLAIDGAIHYQLGQDPATWRARRTWSALGVVVPIGLFLVVVLAVGMPMIALLSALSK
jgi:hypothetical protein